MATSPTQVRIDENTKQQAVALLEGLGLNLSSAVNMFLKQVILRNGIPFEIKYPELKPEVIEKVKEAKQLNGDPDTKKYSYEDFLEIIATLRSENGCPWDKVQTHESLKPCMMEEAAELLASIRIFDQTGNPENMIEELGDVLLQVVMHAQIASEEGLFTMEDVVNEVSQKMVRRHPHVFGTGNADTPDEVLVNWEEIKKEEKKDKDWVESPLREIPKELPALTRAVKVLKKIDKHYEKGSTFEENTAAICELATALQDCGLHEDNRKIEEILSDLLLRISDVARIKKIPQEQILTDKIEDLIEKYECRESTE